MLTTAELANVIHSCAPRFHGALRRERVSDHDFVVIELSHPASIGAQLVVPASSPPTMGRVKAWIDGNPEVERVAAAPNELHAELCRDLYIRSQAEHWSEERLREESAALAEAGELSAAELAWIATWEMPSRDD